MAENLLITISCPECTTPFEIEGDLLGTEGRYVACSECDHQWFQYPPAPKKGTSDEATLETQEDIPLIAVSDQEEEYLEEKASFFTKQLFLIPVLLGLIFTGLFFGRNDVVRFVPGMERVYTALGISAYNIAAFRFHNTQWQVINNGMHRSLEITGSVTNTSDKLLTPPCIQVTLRGQGVCQPLSWVDQFLDLEQNENKTCTIGKWMTHLKEGRLFSGQTCSFKVSYPLTTIQLPTEVLLKFVNKNE
ncbi:MAG: hypothetical protein A2621_03510 [Alphaproteobacteria bacterium RIFCSPHIGHO2_01_FULL_41_14]|nr:MAG: hypothetical protein A2065_03550 [Alphaproteobacteria bacterium GWB1_45_5]OFW75835.1 MAG: hypothetical protein A3K20_03310 [Alphaproteobacteria bacterium GWA1_45_9]OFW89923.1 MAG: hypothetical protein A2621_03510 [Alphaproteobacteria bacterium RIFCSPHIGHO2_01_FULL_41_14]HCI48361.1 hypothetical protein [Holosporales bacterium]